MSDQTITETMENMIKSILKPFSLFHSFVSSFTLIVVILALSILGYFTYQNNKLTQHNTNQLELTNKYYVLQNQTSILLKIIDENLRESKTAKLGSAPMELKVQTAKIMNDMATLKQVPLHILCGIAEVESSWNTNAISEAGCVGLLQITPMYARVYLREKGINYKKDIWFDPTINIMCGVSMLDDAQAEHLEKGRTEKGDWKLAIHSYFWGAVNTNQLFGKTDQRVSVPNMAYPMRVIEASKKYKELGL